MGTDIHAWIEKRVDGKWTLVPARRGEPGFSEYYNDGTRWDGTSEAWWHLRCAQWDIDRNYNLFAVLADVRNGRGFAGVRTGDGFEPILSFTDGDGELSHRRGWPTDCCAELAAEDIDHSPSWLTVAELNAYNWTDQITRECGCVYLPQYVAWRDAGAKGCPESWCGHASGPGVEILTPERADALLRIGERSATGWKGNSWHMDPPTGHPHTYVEIHWIRTYADAAGDFCTKHLPALNEIAEREGVAPHDLRLVFYFDS